MLEQPPRLLSFAVENTIEQDHEIKARPGSIHGECAGSADVNAERLTLQNMDTAISPIIVGVVNVRGSVLQDEAIVFR